MTIDEAVVVEFNLSGIPDLELFSLGRAAARLEREIEPHCPAAAGAVHHCVVDAIISEQVRRLECPGGLARNIFVTLAGLREMSIADLRMLVRVLQQGADGAHAAGYRSVTFWSTLAQATACELDRRGESVLVAVDRQQWERATTEELERLVELEDPREEIN